MEVIPRRLLAEENGLCTLGAMSVLISRTVFIWAVNYVISIADRKPNTPGRLVQSIVREISGGGKRSGSLSNKDLSPPEAAESAILVSIRSHLSS